MAKLSSLEFNSNTFAERLAELEEAIEAVDAYRKQTNQTIADLDQLSSKPALIDTPIMVKLIDSSYAHMVELVDTLVLGTSAARCGGSTPSMRTKNF